MPPEPAGGARPAGALVPAGRLLAAAARRIDRLDAEVLLAHLLGCDRLELLARSDACADPRAFAALVARRAAGEPVAYITGRREFWSLMLEVTPDVLVPRPDSELLIEAAIRLRRDAPPALVLDLGTGSGALLLAALTAFPGAFGLGIDRSGAALGVARRNAMCLGLAHRAAFACADWGAPLAFGRFGLVLANPPYVAEGEALPREVAAHEPAAALFAGPDGLAALRCLLPQIARLIRADGLALVEHGATQQAEVLRMARAAGLRAQGLRDLGGRPRAVALERA